MNKKEKIYIKFEKFIWDWLIKTKGQPCGLEEWEELKKEFFVALDSIRQETAEDICRITDKIEISYRDTSLEEWKAFKRIRNSIRDKYLKTKNE